MHRVLAGRWSTIGHEWDSPRPLNPAAMLGKTANSVRFMLVGISAVTPEKPGLNRPIATRLVVKAGNPGNRRSLRPE